jgi:DNA-binding response OmpR family regulator
MKFLRKGAIKMFSVLVVEDDTTLNKMIVAKFRQEQFTTFSAFDGMEALNVLDQEYIDLIICDIMMPKMDGLELTKTLREADFTQPILMITAKDQLEDLEAGFHAGSDDYMVKPIQLKEMMLRAHALLRRAKIASEKKIVVGSVTLNYEELSVKTSDETYELAPKEFYLLYKLLSNPNKIFTRLELLDEIWGLTTESDERNVDAHIKKLRRKFEHYPDFELVTVRGIGYKAKI